MVVLPELRGRARHLQRIGGRPGGSADKCGPRFASVIIQAMFGRALALSVLFVCIGPELRRAGAQDARAPSAFPRSTAAFLRSLEADRSVDLAEERPARVRRSRSGWFWLVAGVAVSAAVVGIAVGVVRVLEEDHDEPELLGDDGTISYTLRGR